MGFHFSYLAYVSLWKNTQIYENNESKQLTMYTGSATCTLRRKRIKIYDFCSLLSLPYINKRKNMYFHEFICYCDVVMSRKRMKDEKNYMLAMLDSFSTRDIRIIETREGGDLCFGNIEYESSPWMRFPSFPAYIWCALRPFLPVLRVSKLDFRLACLPRAIVGMVWWIVNVNQSVLRVNAHRSRNENVQCMQWSPARLSFAQLSSSHPRAA